MADVQSAEPIHTQPADDPIAVQPRPRRRMWLRALAAYLVMVFALVTLNFFIPRVMPGDPLNGLIAQAPAEFAYGEDTKQALREYYNLDGPLWEQYRHYLARLAHGDFGRSIFTNQSVWKEMSRRLPWTLLLVTSSVFLAALLGGVAGVHSGWKRDRPVDRAMMTSLISVWQFPPYLLASLLAFLFVVKLGWFPLTGGEAAFSDYGPLRRFVDIAWHLTLPLFVLTVALAAENYLVMRAGMIRELGSDHLLLGRAKGLSERRLKYHYAARNAVLPLVALTAVNIGFAIGANIIVERIFTYPGLGNYMFESIGTKDYPTMQGTFLILALMVVTANAIADVVYRRLDPRTTL